MHCPFCRKEVASNDDLQLHCLVDCTAAYTDTGASTTSRIDSVVVRFRWVKERHCIEREVHLISSLAGSVVLYWRELEGLYESETVVVPVGQHTCQLVIGEDIIPTEEFEVNEDSDVIFIIVKEGNADSQPVSNTDGLSRRHSAGDVESDSEPLLRNAHESSQIPLDTEPREAQDGEPKELSPLYRELLRHQLSHGEPSWVPGSGQQSPVMSDTEFRTLPGIQGDDPPILSSQPRCVELQQGSSYIAALGGLQLDSRSAELSDDSDRALSPPDRGSSADRNDLRAGRTGLSSGRGPPSSSSPVPSSHSEHNDSGGSSSRQSPVDSVLSDAGAEEGSLISPPLNEDLQNGRCHDQSDGNFLTEGEPTDAVAPSGDADLHNVDDENRFIAMSPFRPEEELQTPPAGVQTLPTEQAANDQSSSRASPLGSVLDAVLLPVRDSGMETSNPHEFSRVFLESAAHPPERTSPAGSVQSSSLFSSGLPSPLASPGGPKEHDAAGSLVHRASPSVSTRSETQPPPRPQSLGGSFNISETVPTSMFPQRRSTSGSPVESHRGSISGAEQSPTTVTAQPTRQSPTGSVRSTDFSSSGVASAHMQHHDSSSHSSQRSTPVHTGNSVVGRSSAAATPPVVLPTGSRSSHRDSHSGASSVHSAGYRSAGAGSPSDLLMEVVHRQGPPSGPSRSVTSRGSGRQSPASSVYSLADRSSPRVVSPPRTQTSGIPSHESAFATLNDDRRALSVASSLEEAEALRQERDTLVRELKQRRAHYEAELRRQRSRNADLEQQILSIETVATLTKQNDQKTDQLEQRVNELNRTVRERDEEISRLKEYVTGLERSNQLLKEEQESLKTVNALRLEDVNKINTDLQEELSDLRRRSSEAVRTQRSRDEGKIIELQVLQNTLEQHVKNLELENKNLRKQLGQSKQELEIMKTEKDARDYRLSKARSETDLSSRFDRFSTYDMTRYKDTETTRTVSFAPTSSPSKLGTDRYTSLDVNYTRAYQAPIIMNGHSSVRAEATKTRHSLPHSYQDRMSRNTHSSKLANHRSRFGSLGDESDISDDLEHGLLDTSHRLRNVSSESSASSVVSWDHDFTTDTRQLRAGYDSLLKDDTRQTRSVSRRRRPHSYDGAVSSLHDVYSKDLYPASSDREKAFSCLTQGTGAFDSSHSSSYSTDSPLLTTSTRQTSVSAQTKDKLFTKPFAPSSSRDVQLGMEVLVTRSRGQIGRGVVKYVGPLPGHEDTYIGVELKAGQVGKHDGSFHGRRLFYCKQNRGIFVNFNKVVMCYG